MYHFLHWQVDPQPGRDHSVANLHTRAAEAEPLEAEPKAEPLEAEPKTPVSKRRKLPDYDKLFSEWLWEETRTSSSPSPASDDEELFNPTLRQEAEQPLEARHSKCMGWALH